MSKQILIKNIGTKDWSLFLQELLNTVGEHCYSFEIDDEFSGQIEAGVKVQIAKIVKDIMQEGFEIAMGGNIDLSEEANRREQTARYDRAIKNYTNIISNLSA